MSDDPTLKTAEGHHTDEELAEAITAVLTTADDAGMSIETQIEVLEKQTEAMREALA